MAFRGGGPGGLQTIENCKEEDRQLARSGQGIPFDPKGPRQTNRHTVLATVASMPMDRPPCYPSCPEMVEGFTRTPGAERPMRACQKKMSDEGNGMWRCANGHCCQAPAWRYLGRMNVVDHTDQTEVNFFHETGQKLFGVDAQEFNRLWEEDQQMASSKVPQIAERALWQRVHLRVRSQKEIWQEAERAKVVVDEVSLVGLLKEAQQMLNDVKASIAAM